MKIRCRFATPLLLGLLLALAPGCGKKGPPIKPQPRLPAPPENFDARQRGERVELKATFSLVGLRGRSVRPPLRAALLSIVVPGAAQSAGWTRSSRDREFLRGAQERELSELDEALVGESVNWEERLALADVAPAGQVVLGVSLRDRWGRSMPSRRVVLNPQRPGLAALQSFEARAEADAVRLIWAGGDERATHVRIYKAVGGADAAWEPWRVVPLAAGELLDQDVSYGQDLVYAATAGLVDIGTGSAAVESELSPAVAIAYRDVFPPLPPEAVDAVSIEQRVRVLWNPGRSPDEALSLIERQVEGEEGWTEVGRVALPETYFVDENVSLGRRYRYRVTAIDAAGNAGDPAGPTAWVEARPPRPERTAP